MSLENATKISELVATNPPGTDPVSQGDDHIRMIKNVLQLDAVAKTGAQTMAGPLTVTDKSGQLAGFRNKIINGGMDTWQRGTSFSANGYTADRWLANYDGSGGTLAISLTAFSNYPYLYWNQSVAPSGATYRQIEQRIEDVKTLEGKPVTLSLRGLSANSTQLTVAYMQNFGSGGSATVAGSAGTISLTGSSTKHSVSFALPSVAGKTLGANSYVAIILQASNPNSVFDFALREVQLEEGSIATPFELRPVGTELSLCQRYYEKVDISNFLFIGTVSTSNGYFLVPVGCATEKRVKPTVTLTGGSFINSINIETIEFLVFGKTNAVARLRGTVVGQASTESVSDSALAISAEL